MYMIQRLILSPPQFSALYRIGKPALRSVSLGALAGRHIRYSHGLVLGVGSEALRRGNHQSALDS